MAESRKRISAVLLKISGKTAAEWTLEVFDARDWPDEPEADAGLFRLRVGGKWVTDAGRKHTFFTVWGLALLIARALLGVLKLGSLDQGQPDLRKGQYVRWVPHDLEAPATQTVAASEPIHCIDGQWRIMVCGRLVPCAEVQGLDRYGRSIEPKQEAAPAAKGE